MFPIFLHIGPLTLHTYGLLIAVGFLLALRVARSQFQRRGLPSDRLDPIVFYLMIFGLIGARLFYFSVDGFAALKEDPLGFFRIWEGGLVLYGGVLAGVIVLTVCSLIEEIPFFKLTDAFAAPLLLGQAIGRLGCFAAGCCYGRPTEAPWGVTFRSAESLAPRFTPLHPTQIYESLGDFLLFAVAMMLSRKPSRTGTMTAYYLMAYSAFRFFMEFFRGDDRGLAHYGFSPSQLIALALFITGAGLFIYVQKQKSKV